ncbi:MAG: tetratricopeptide repeat protein [Terriglobales bacterium]|jgi:Flp pilus assembly protein TadD
MAYPRSLRRISQLFLVTALGCGMGHAADLHIKIPKRSKPTPVQQYNRDGVKAIEKRDFKKAKQLFYKAYLLDPNDPFTLNNLGYISELEGDVDRAARFYDLSAENSSEALVDRASSKDIQGKTVAQVAGRTGENSLEVNRMNVTALSLLQKDRAPEADVLLTKALAVDPKNPFTLNNLGFAKEKEGELEQALSYYDKAAQMNSRDKIIVTVHQSWRGKPISDVASDNAKKVRDEIRHGEDTQARVARLNLRGVSAINRNERQAARQYFEQAYKLDPNNAFALNNMGYLAEMDGDQETATFYYEKAQTAQRADRKVSVATRRDAEGQPVAGVATASGQQVTTQMEAALEQKRREGGPVVLRQRDNTPVQPNAEPAPPSATQPVATPPQTQPSATPGQDQNLPAGDQGTVGPATPNATQPGAVPQQNPPSTMPQQDRNQTVPPAGQGNVTPTPQTIYPPTQQNPPPAQPSTNPQQPQ